jgi:hypoxanthine phosphoribosyltransferase
LRTGARLERRKTELLIDSETIREKILETAERINRDYAGREVTLVMVLKGSLFFVADLMRAITIPCRLEVVRASSYGMRGSQRGELEVFGIQQIDVASRHVILIDDIFDSGKTLSSLVEAIRLQHPASLKTIVLLCKKTTRHTSYHPDEALFEIEDAFVVGFGLDYKEYDRGLNGIYRLL